MSVPPIDAGSRSAGSSAPPQGYVVRSGDTLTGIAQAHGVSLSALEAANPHILHPDLIYPGQHVTIPEGGSGGSRPSPGGEYTVKAGDTLSAIGDRFGVDWRTLAQVNHLSNPNLIHVGQELQVGGGGSAGGVKGAGPASSPPGSSANAAAIAKSYLGQNASSLKVDGSDKLPMDPNCPSSECCANFVSAVLVQAGQLPANLHTDSVAQLKSTLEARGWTAVSAADAKPGDVVIMQGGGISHTEMVSGPGQMIGSNNTNADGSQRVGYNSLSYAASHGGLILRAPGGQATAPTSATGGAGSVGAPGATVSARTQQAVSYFESQGWSHAQAAGIAANLQTESSLNVGARGDGGQAYGLAQWHPDRQATFERVFGHSIQGSSFQDQLKFVQYELTHTESSAGSRLRGAGSAAEAGAIVSRYYERPLAADAEAASRGALASRVEAGTH